MKNILVMLLIIVATVSSFAQTVLIDPNGDGAFENGTTFAANGWMVVNDNINRWEVGTAKVYYRSQSEPRPAQGGWSAYISDNGGTTNTYVGTLAQVSHFYRDVTFPAGETMIILDFIVSGGFYGGAFATNRDVIKVFLIPTESTPFVGIELVASGQLGLSEGYTGYWDAGTGHRIVIPSYFAGTTKRLVFSWENNGEAQWDPPGAIDNISLVSEGSVTSNGTGGGAWSSTATWTGGVPPGTTDNVTIRDPVTFDLPNTTIQNLVLQSGAALLEFNPGVDRTMTVTRDIVVDNDAIFRSALTGTAVHDLIVGGSLINNGIVDFSTNGNTSGFYTTFNGSTDALFSGTGSTDIGPLIIDMAGTATTTAVTLEIILDNLTAQGASTDAPAFLELVRGRVRLGGSFPMESIVFPSTSPVIATGTALWLDNPNLRVKAQNGSMTVQGTLHMSAGALNVGEDGDDCIILVPGSTTIVEGGAIGVAAAMGVSSQFNVVKYQQTGGAITVAKFGNSSTTFPSFSLGNSSNATTTAGTIVIQHANSAGSGVGDFGMPLTASITGGTLQLGNATTTAPSLWRIRGGIPNLVIDQTHNHTVQLTASTKFTSSANVPLGATLDLNGWGLEAKKDIMIDGTLDAAGAAPGNGGSITFSGSEPQSFSGSGIIVDNVIDAITINNSSGASPAVVIDRDIIIGETLNLNGGPVGGGGQITIGNSAASTTFNIRRAGNGKLLNQPTFNLNGVTFNATYNFSSLPMVTDVELPSTFSGTLMINNSNGVILNATTTAQKLTLTNGILTTASTSALIIAGTNPTDVSGGSSTSYVKGPLIRTLRASLATGTEYSFPVGKNSYNPVSLVDAITNAGGATMIRAEVSEENPGGTAGTGLGEISPIPNWDVGPTTLPDLIVEQLRLRFGNRSNLGAGSRIGKSETAGGTYNSIGGTVSGNAITSDVINGFSYFVIGVTDNTFSGTYTVGSSGANYSTITGAINAMTAGGFTGPVVVTLQDASYPSETFPITIGQIAGANATNTLTIKPAAGIAPTITGAPFNTAIIKLEGADYVTIDGSNNGTNSRDMTISNTYGGGGHAIWLSSQGAGMGARNNVLKNLNISAGSDQTQNNTITAGILSSGTTISVLNDGADNDNNLIQNNYIKKARYGIFLRGAAANPNDGNSILSNLVGPDAFGSDQIGKGGIVVQSQSGVTISNNEVRFVGALASQSIPEAASEDRVGIGLGAEFWTPGFFDGSTITNAVVTNNFVHDVIEEKTKSAAGIISAAGGSPTNNLVANNIVYNVHANGTSGEQGVGIGIHAGSGDKIVFNSIRLEGDIDPPSSITATGNGAGIRVTGGSNLTIKNNIISVDLTSNVDTVKHYAIVAPSFYNWGTGGVDYNDYYVNASNVQMRVGGIGSVGIPLTGYTDLPAWRTNFAGTQDVHSKNFAPDFTSATDLHLNLSSVNPDYIALPIAGVTTDFDGQTRSTTAPYKGADENIVYLLPDLIAPAAPLSAAVADSGNTTVTLRWRKNTEPDFLRYRIYGGTSANPTSKADSTTGGVGDTTKTISALMNGTRYYFRITAVDNAENESGYSNEVNAKPGDYVPPGIPQSLVVTDSSSGTITVKWRKNNDPDFMRYRIYRGTAPSPTVKVDSTTGGVSDTSKTFSGLVSGVRYYLRVTAVDSAGNESSYSNEVDATPTAGNIAPSAPLSLVVTDSSSTTITVKWRKNNESDFLRYRIYSSTSPSPTTKVDSTTAGVSDTSKTFAGLTNGTRYYFRITAVDSAGNESGYSNEASAIPGDRIARAAPANLVVVDSTSTKIGIKWRRNTDPDFLRYRIYRGTAPNPVTVVDSTSGGAADTSKTFTNLTNGTRYYLRVTSVDSSGNESAYSNEVNAAPDASVSVNDPFNQIPKEYSLSQNYPNPFNPSTVVRYGVPVRSRVKLELYDILGRKVLTLVDEVQDAHFYEKTWYASVSSGLYFYRLEAVSTEDSKKSFVQVRKMLLLK